MYSWGNLSVGVFWDNFVDGEAASNAASNADIILVRFPVITP